jgi:DNA-binding LacI/PurR family transcriptional regulator
VLLRGDWTPASGHGVGREIVERVARGEVTAVFCGNDQMALGLVHALAEAGVSVPGDVSIVGFDDIPEAAHFLPPLTTVRQDFEALGRLIMTTVEAVLAGDSTPVASIATELVVRGSTAAPGPVVD